MPSRPLRLLAFLLQSDWRRLAASLLTPLLLGLTFGCGYIAALSVGQADAITPVDQPLVATIDCGAASLAAPPATGVRVGAPRAFVPERPRCSPDVHPRPPAL